MTIILSSAAAIAMDTVVPAVASETDVAKIVRKVAKKYGINPNAFEKMGRIESGLNPLAFNSHSKAAGVFQFIPATARRYALSNPYDVEASASAAAHLWNDNKRYLEQALHRSASPGMIYLAHQQGAGGAVRLLSNPNAPAYTIVGRQAVLLNGGTLTMSAAGFANIWMKRFD